MNLSYLLFPEFLYLLDENIHCIYIMLEHGCLILIVRQGIRFLPVRRNHSGAVEFVILVLLYLLLDVRTLLHEDDRPLVYPYLDELLWLLFLFHCCLFLGNKKPASPFGGVGENKKAEWLLAVPLCILFIR